MVTPTEFDSVIARKFQARVTAVRTKAATLQLQKMTRVAAARFAAAEAADQAREQVAELRARLGR